MILFNTLAKSDVQNLKLFWRFSLTKYQSTKSATKSEGSGQAVGLKSDVPKNQETDVAIVKCNP